MLYPSSIKPLIDSPLQLHYFKCLSQLVHTLGNTCTTTNYYSRLRDNTIILTSINTGHSHNHTLLLEYTNFNILKPFSSK
jgi:hypothetical protein